MVHVSQKKERSYVEWGRPRRKEKEMALRSRIVALVIAALLSVAGASVTAAAAADNAQAALGHVIVET